MNKLFIILAALAMVLLSFVSCSTASQSDDNVLVLATHPGYAPYESIDAQGNIVGFDIDLAKAIAEHLGKELKIVQAQFDSLILGLRQGKCDLVMAGISITADRTKEVAMVPYHGESVSEVALVFWEHIPENLCDLKSIAQSEKPTIAVMQGTWQELFLNKVSGISCRSLDSNTDLIMDLKYGKSAAALFEGHVALALQQKIPELKIVSHPLPKEYHVLGDGIAIQKQNETLIQQVQDAVLHLKKTGVMAKLEAEWFSGDEA